MAASPADCLVPRWRLRASHVVRTSPAATEEEAGGPADVLGQASCCGVCGGLSM